MSADVIELRAGASADLQEWARKPKMVAFVRRLEPIYDRLEELNREMVEIETGLAHELGLPPIRTYVIEAVGSDMVKIGKTYDVQSRLRTLRTGSPLPLRLWRVIPFDCERAMHAKYAALRSHGEWFTFDPDMLEDSFHEPLLEMAKQMIAAS